MTRKRVPKTRPPRGGKPITCDSCGRGKAPLGGNCNFCGGKIECDPHGGTMDQAAFENAIRDNLSPAGVAALIMALQPAGSIQSTTAEGEQAIDEVLRFRDTLLEMIGVDTFNRTLDELGF
jgi:hypothetical protein